MRSTLLLPGMIILSLGGAHASAVSGPIGPPAPAPSLLTVTTDTPEYCRSLARLVGSHRDLPREASHLLGEGREMCGQGLVRAGIARLRRAMLLLDTRRVDSTAP